MRCSSVPAFAGMILLAGPRRARGLAAEGVAEEAVLIPARRFPPVRDLARDQIVQLREAGARLPVEGLGEVVLGAVIAGVEKGAEASAAAIGEAGHQEHRRDSLLDEAVMVGAGEQPLFGQRI